MLLGTGIELDIFLAAQLDMTDRVEAMLRAEPELARVRNGAGSTVLHGAVYWGARRTAELLLRAGADATAVATSGLQIAPLGSAVASADVPNPSRDEPTVVSLVLLLLSYGADVNHRRRDGLTALHTAAARGHLDVMRALLVAGADAGIEGREGGPHARQTAAIIAESLGQTAAAELLRDYLARTR
jgi:ankyrin repeat protein